MNLPSRRSFLQTLSVASVALATTSLTAAEPKAETRPRIKLGYDNFAVRAMGWKAAQLINYAAELKIDSLFISDLDAFESLEPKYLREVKAQATDKGLQLHVGTWSICPTSTTFKNKWGTAEEHLLTGIRVAKELGSPVIRVILGNRSDRLTPGGIEARIEDTVKVCKACRAQAIDAGVKIAVENHAGDMRADELITLIEAAGKDYVGANVDSGNAVWALEDPLDNLEKLAPYALTTSLRDTTVWETKQGAALQWRAMGEGTIDQRKYFERFAALCPQVPVHIETIGGFNLDAPILVADFWKSYPNLKASELAKFILLAKGHEPLGTFKKPDGAAGKTAEQEFQRGELERSLKFCKEELGLGVRR
ncbi:MAG TPA: sugar phosphate isomerase/epimerase [Pirellulaceae bacterium]|nr:sugar phosphate isomerase/epimerase [Pirellulaceae bacterium]